MAHTLYAWRRWWRVVNAEESPDAPNHAADRSGDNGTDRTCNAITFSCAMFKAPGKTSLGLSRHRCSQGHNDDACT